MTYVTILRLTQKKDKTLAPAFEVVGWSRPLTVTEIIYKEYPLSNRKEQSNDVKRDQKNARANKLQETVSAS